MKLTKRSLKRLIREELEAAEGQNLVYGLPIEQAEQLWQWLQIVEKSMAPPGGGTYKLGSPASQVSNVATMIIDKVMLLQASVDQPDEDSEWPLRRGD